MNNIVFPSFLKYDGQLVRYIQPKLDGHLAKVYRSKQYPDGIRVLTKNDKDITRKIMFVSHIRHELLLLPADSVVFGELHCPGDFATNVPTRLNNADEALQLSVFAVPYFNNLTPASTDPAFILRSLAHHGLEVVDTETFANGPVRLSQFEIGNYLSDAKILSLEGWVLKERHMSGWYKLKPTKTIDAFVMGVRQSFSASNYGGLKSLLVAVFNDDQTVCDLGQVGGGFDHDFRMSICDAKSRASLLHRVCEIEYDSLAANGKLRFPRFLRWRDDKDWQQCTSNQF